MSVCEVIYLGTEPQFLPTIGVTAEPGEPVEVPADLAAGLNPDLWDVVGNLPADEDGEPEPDGDGVGENSDGEEG